MKQYLITGASGFLGQTLLAALCSQTERKKLFLLSRQAGLQTPSATWITGDLDSFEKNPDLLENETLDGIYHLAAVVRHSRKDSSEVYHSNVNGTLNMVKLAARKHCRMVYVSTSGVVGCFDQSGKQADENSNYAVNKIKNWPYYDSKMQAEIQARELASRLGVSLIVMRPPVLLGPGDRLGRSTHLIRKLLAGKLPVIIRGGYHYVDIRDVAQALLNAMSLEHPRPIYHLAGKESTLMEFCRDISRIAGVKVPTLELRASWLMPFSSLLSFVPDRVMLEMGSSYWGLKSLYAEQDLNFKSRSPEATLQDTIRDLPSELH